MRSKAGDGRRKDPRRETGKKRRPALAFRLRDQVPRCARNEVLPSPRSRRGPHNGNQQSAIFQSAIVLGGTYGSGVPRRDRRVLEAAAANFSKLRVWHGPPNAEDDPQPASSISTTSTFGAPCDGRIGWIVGYFVSGSFASKVVGAIGRLTVGDRQYFALERVSYWHLRAYGSPCSVVVRGLHRREVWGRGVLYRLAQGGHSGL